MGTGTVSRLFLDGIDLQRRGMRVAQAVELAAFVRADVAEPGLPSANMAVPRGR
jgi:hypothetical protein